MRLLFVIWLAGCAMATERTANDANGSGTDGSPHDGPQGGGCTMAKTGVLASWSFASQPGNQASTPAATSAPGLVAGDVTRAPALTAVTGTNSMNSATWPSATMLDSMKYYAVAVTPPGGCVLDLTSASIDAFASGTGPQSAVIAASTDNFALTKPVTTSAPSTPTITTVTAAPGKVELRIYGYNASSTSGTLRLQNTLSLTGSLR